MSSSSDPCRRLAVGLLLTAGLLLPVREASAGRCLIPGGDREAAVALETVGIETTGRTAAGLIIECGDGEEPLIRRLGYNPVRFDPLLGPFGRYYRNRAGAVTAFPNWNEMESRIRAVAADWPDRVRLQTLGVSLQGRPLLALEISDSPEADGEVPEVRLAGCHHGDEKMSALLAVRLAEHLAGSDDPRTRQLVAARRIWAVPVVNPDGYAAHDRTNDRGVDLNRNYGYLWDDGSGRGSGPYSEPETAAMAAHAFSRNIVFGLSFHTSGDIVNTVWNYSPLEPADQTEVRAVADRYGELSGYRVTGGYDWYQTLGDLNDFSYGTTSAIDYTIELSDYDEQAVFNANLEATLTVIDAAAGTVRGRVADARSHRPLAAVLEIAERGWAFYTDHSSGRFFRAHYERGTIDLSLWAPGYRRTLVPGIALPPTAQGIDLGTLPLEPDPDGSAWAFRAVVVRGSDILAAGGQAWLIGPPDGRDIAFGDGWSAIVDLSRTIDAPDAGFIVAYGSGGGRLSLLCSLKADGPWSEAAAYPVDPDGPIRFAAAGPFRYLQPVDRAGDGGIFRLDAIGFEPEPVDGDLDPDPDPEFEPDAEPEAEADGDADLSDSADSERETETGGPDGDFEQIDGDVEADADADADPDGRPDGDVTADGPDQDQDQDQDPDLDRADGDAVDGRDGDGSDAGDGRSAADGWIAHGGGCGAAAGGGGVVWAWLLLAGLAGLRRSGRPV